VAGIVGTDTRCRWRFDGRTLSYHISQSCLSDVTSVRQLAAQRADATSVDICAVSESLFGNHVFMACTRNVPLTSEPVGWPVAGVLGDGCRLHAAEQSDADGRPPTRLHAVAAVASFGRAAQRSLCPMTWCLEANSCPYVVSYCVYPR